MSTPATVGPKGAGLNFQISAAEDMGMHMRGRNFVLQDNDCSLENSSLEDEEPVRKTLHRTPHMIHGCHERHKCRVHHTILMPP